jgi:LPPG:FO 2-phospho-L-lactate transferase
MNIVLLCGGVGGARLLLGFELLARQQAISVTAIVNTGDDCELYGLHISPDIDTVLYTLSGVADEERGWGVRDETYLAMETLKTLGDDTWFTLGDRDIGTHMYRTKRLANGEKLSKITREMARKRGILSDVLPMSDDPVRTYLRLDGWTEPVPFQEYFVKLRHEPVVSAIEYTGSASANPAPGVVPALKNADLIVVAPSNPFLSINPILSVDPLQSLLEQLKHKCIAVSPIIHGQALKGPLASLLEHLTGEASALSVANLYRSYARALYIDPSDSDTAGEIEALGIEPVITNITVTEPASALTLAKEIVNGAHTSKD